MPKRRVEMVDFFFQEARKKRTKRRARIESREGKERFNRCPRMIPEI